MFQQNFRTVDKCLLKQIYQNTPIPCCILIEKNYTEKNPRKYENLKMKSNK